VCDEFGYNNDKLASKTRYYVDDSNRIFLVDDFAVDGLLVHKRGCPDGLQNPCVDYYDIMRSPLPALGQLYFYR
jgi:hypothetical protein